MVRTGVSVIIVTWNSKEAVIRCLRSLDSLDKSSLDLETIVVDNGSRDGTAQALSADPKMRESLRMKVIANRGNLGLSRATEQGYAIAQGDWVLLCNPDTVFSTDFLRMISFARSQSDFSILAAEMMEPDGTVQRVVVRRFPTVARVFFSFSVLGSQTDLHVLGKFFSDEYTYANATFDSPVSSVDQPGASFLLMSRDAIERMGGIFSDEFPIWWNDVDLAMRARKVNLRRGIMPNVRVIHELGHSANKMSRPDRRYIFCLAMVTYCRKWKLHPYWIRSLFFIDGVLNIIVGWPLWKARVLGSGGLREGIDYSKMQLRAIISG